ncbi:MAG TPA: vanadium-dependent haloperoxidase [Chitinophagaceae bacterium]|nr:vanadium-dependent haloperoxidase [Chitinophagaceae bacterium]
MKQLLTIICCFWFIFSGCKQEANPDMINKFCANQLPDWNNKLTQVIISDIFTPPVCSRIYAYTNIAAYEALRQGYKDYPSYAGKLNGLQTVPQPKEGTAYNYTIAGVIAFTTVAQKLVFNSDAIKNMENEFLEQLDSINVNEKLLNNSTAYGREVGNHIIAWAARDGYLERNSLPAYIVTKEEGRWQPTPPNYADAIETNWKMLRPLVLDSCSQFRPVPPTKYDTTKNSAFYKEAYQVYEAVKNPKEGDSETAWYWDDNPNTSVTDGHVTYFQQKNSPPGHWIHIACSVAQKEKYDVMKTTSLISKTAIALYDAFISCWDAKYTYNYIRPETFINKYIDKEWIPLIQTPAFPEYPSGHSVASSSAATVLTQMLGPNYIFTDSAEVPFGRPARTFNSFYQAADQACISRLMGGIHFLPAIENGKEEGRKLGNFIISKLN